MKMTILAVLLALASFGSGSVIAASTANEDGGPHFAVELEANSAFVAGQTGFYTLRVSVDGTTSTMAPPFVTLTVPPALVIIGMPTVLVGMPSNDCSVSGQTVTCALRELLASPAPPAVVWVPVTPVPGAGGTVVAAVAYLVGAAPCVAQACASNVVTSPVLAPPPPATSKM